MKYAVLILFYDCDQFILRTIANCAPHVDKIYVTHSPMPWGYNPEARDKYKNPSDPSILRQSENLDKIELVEGDWLTEEDQRNEVLDKAKAEGFDYLIVQDADEFFRYEDYAANLQEIEANPNFAYYRTPWYQFWKSLEHVVICRYSYTYKRGKVDIGLKNTPISYSMAFALNLNTDIRFEHCRRPTHLDDYHVLEGVCYHLSYVMSDAQVERKIRTYGHSQQIDHDKWLARKWYGWRENSRCLHPLNPAIWMRTERFEGTLPEELEGFALPDQVLRPLSWNQKLLETVDDGIALSVDSVKSARAALKRIGRSTK